MKRYFGGAFVLLFMNLPIALPAQETAEKETMGLPATAGNGQDSLIDGILRQVDRYRGLERSYTADLEIKYYENNKEKSGNTFRAMVRFREQKRDILLRYLTPATDYNNLILSRDDKMWIYMRKTSRPIPISMQQRLLGDASVGDVLNVEFRNRYKGTMTRQDKTILISLDAVNASALYEKVQLTVDERSYRPIQARFLTRNGKELKLLRFVSFIKTNGREIASQMEIADRIEKARMTRIKFSGFSFSVLPAGYFEKDNLRTMQFGE